LCWLEACDFGLKAGADSDELIQVARSRSWLESPYLFHHLDVSGGVGELRLEAGKSFGSLGGYHGSDFCVKVVAPISRCA
jgi:hypothetical protein